MIFKNLLFYSFLFTNKVLNEITSYNINSGMDKTKNDTDNKFNFLESYHKLNLLKTLQNNNVSINNKLHLIKYNDINNKESYKSINLTAGGLYKDFN